MKNALNHRLIQQLEKRKNENAFRALNELNPKAIDFCSNDFLGIRKNSALISQIRDQINHSNFTHLGAGASRLLGGNNASMNRIEVLLAKMFESEAALFMNSGYLANLAFLSTLPSRNDVIFYDEHCHASIKDGMRLSLADKKSFRHNDVVDLEKRLHQYADKVNSSYVIVESLYSMDGDFCHLKDVLKVCQKYNAYVVVDEAHSTGLYGEKSGSWVVEQNLQNDVFARIHTFGKAVGMSGACIVGNEDLKDYLINFARPFIYTTGANQLTTIGLEEALKFVQDTDQGRKDLHQNIAYFKDSVNTTSISAIQPVVIGGNEKTKFLASELQAQGFEVRAVLSPTVSKGTERLRICLHSFNTKEEIERLTSQIHEFQVKNKMQYHGGA